MLAKKVRLIDLMCQGRASDFKSSALKCTYLIRINFDIYIYTYIHKIVCYLDLDCKSQGALSTSESSLECFCVRRQGATRKRETERVRDYNYHMKIWVVVLGFKYIFDFRP